MKQFNELGLSDQALEAVARLGYEAPTPVQEQAIPLALEGRDLIAAAKTGTGKTAAFSLPSLDRLGHAKGGQGPLMLVVTPTRELAQQIGEVCAAVAVSTHHRIATVVGGLSYTPQINKLKHGVDILIATPGRLVDLMEQGAVRLGDVEVLVLDEADRMLDMGFLPDVTTIVDATPECRQTLLFSATIDQSIQKNLGSLLNDPAMVEIARNGETAKTVEQFMMPIKNFNKPELLEAVLREKGSERIIVFARTKNRTEDCAEALCDAGYRAESIHSDKSQGARRRALENFRRGKTSILVATDVLARGIDVESVAESLAGNVPETASARRDSVRIALTKGRLEKKTLALLKASGYDISELEAGSRKLIFTLPGTAVEIVLAKAADVITYVEHGVCDMGVVGKDTIMEKGGSFYEMVDLGFGKCRFALATKKGKDVYGGYKTPVIATKYPAVTRAFFARKNMDVETIKIEGSVELAPLLELADAIVDIVETGTTLKENGLEVIEDVAPISARVIVNLASAKMKKAAIQQVIAELESGLDN